MFQQCHERWICIILYFIYGETIKCLTLVKHVQFAIRIFLIKPSECVSLFFEMFLKIDICWVWCFCNTDYISISSWKFLIYVLFIDFVVELHVHYLDVSLLDCGLLPSIMYWMDSNVRGNGNVFPLFRLSTCDLVHSVLCFVVLWCLLSLLGRWLQLKLPFWRRRLRCKLQLALGTSEQKFILWFQLPVGHLEVY